MNKLTALMLLQECSGDEIWSAEHCRQRGVPENWIVELSDCYESGFDSDRQTIYVEDQVTNQYHGIRDIDLAQHLGRILGLPVDQICQTAPSRRCVVQALKDAAEEH